VSWRWGKEGVGRMRYTSDQVGVLTEDLCRRDVYVDHLLSESLEHVTTLRLLITAAWWDESPSVPSSSLAHPGSACRWQRSPQCHPYRRIGPEVILVQARICDSDGICLCLVIRTVEPRRYDCEDGVAT
jgi:hypothetical protein